LTELNDSIWSCLGSGRDTIIVYIPADSV